MKKVVITSFVVSCLQTGAAFFCPRQKRAPGRARHQVAEKRVGNVSKVCLD